MILLGTENSEVSTRYFPAKSLAIRLTGQSVNKSLWLTPYSYSILDVVTPFLLDVDTPFLLDVDT